MAGSLIQYQSGKTSFIDADAQWVSTVISEAREDRQDFILLETRGRQAFIDPNKVEAVFATDD